MSGPSGPAPRAAQQEATHRGHIVHIVAETGQHKDAAQKDGGSKCRGERRLQRRVGARPGRKLYTYV